jgi:hypothetical protein
LISSSFLRTLAPGQNSRRGALGARGERDMKKLLSVAAVAGLLLAAGCNGSDDTKDGLSAKERSDLDNAAMMLDGNEIIDTSADSLVLDENAAEPAAPAGNVTEPAVNEAAAANSAAPR